MARLHFVHSERCCIHYHKYDVQPACDQALHSFRVTLTRSFPIGRGFLNYRSKRHRSIDPIATSSSVLCPLFWRSRSRQDSLPSYVHSWMTSFESPRSIDLRHVRLIRLSQDLWAQNVQWFSRKTFELVTVWTGQIDFQCTTTGIPKGDEQLHMFEGTNSIAFPFTPRYLKIDENGFQSVQVSAEANEARPLDSFGFRLTYWTAKSTGSTRQTLCSGTLTQAVAVSVITPALRIPKPNRLLT